MTSAPDDLTARLAERARRRWDDATAEILAAEGTDVPALDDDAVVAGTLARLDERAQRDARVVDLHARPRGGAVRWLGAAGAAIAAAMLVWWMRPAAPLLPAYEETFEGGIRSERGDPVEAGIAIELLPSSRIRWSFAPATATNVPVAVRIEARGSTQTCVDPGGVRISPSGAIDVAGTVGEVLDLPAGTWELTALLGPADRIAELADACARESNGTRPAGVVELGRRAIEIRTAP